jgi:hypothetical protein
MGSLRLACKLCCSARVDKLFFIEYWTFFNNLGRLWNYLKSESSVVSRRKLDHFLGDDKLFGKLCGRCAFKNWLSFTTAECLSFYNSDLIFRQVIKLINHLINLFF